MEILIQRRKTEGKSTIGRLSIDGKEFCWTCEDPVREIAGRPVAEWKIPRETAIPGGRYKVTFETSGRFGPDTLTVNDVPGFTAIRIHSGNTAADTEGCLLVGQGADLAAGTIQNSKLALAALKSEVKDAIENRCEEIWITYVNAPAAR